MRLSTVFLDFSTSVVIGRPPIVIAYLYQRTGAAPTLALLRVIVSDRRLAFKSSVPPLRRARRLSRIRDDQARIRGAAVALSPVLAVPVGSISRMCTSSRATGRCSTLVGT